MDEVTRTAETEERDRTLTTDDLAGGRLQARDDEAAATPEEPAADRPLFDAGEGRSSATAGARSRPASLTSRGGRSRRRTRWWPTS